MDRFRCECPACGEIILAEIDPLRQHKRDRLRTRKTKLVESLTRPYNPYTQRLVCPGCRRKYAVGLILWPVQVGTRERQPPDTKPTSRQLRQLRAHASGFWAEAIRKAGDEVNVAVTADCLCPEEGWAPACPVHGVSHS